MKRQTRNEYGEAAGATSVPPESDLLEDLCMVLRSVRAEYEATDEFGCWRLGPDDPGMGDTYWIGRENAEAGFVAAPWLDDDGGSALSGYGCPLRSDLGGTGHPFTSGPNVPYLRLGRPGLEIVAMANTILMSTPVRYDRLAPQERITAVTTAVSEAIGLLATDREAALDRLAGTIGYGEFGRGTLVQRRHALGWLLDGMSPEVIFCRHCGAVVCPDDPIDPRDVQGWELYRLGPTDLSPRLSAHEACQAAHKKEPASWL